MVYPEFWTPADVEFADNCDHPEEEFLENDLWEGEEDSGGYDPFHDPGGYLLIPPGWCRRCGAYFPAERS